MRVLAPHLTVLLLAVLTGSCLGERNDCPGCPTGPIVDPEPSIPDAELRVLFVGNSLTYTNDLPGNVVSLARSNGRSIEVGVFAFPNFSLQEHWATGIADVIRVEQVDVVVMQQGPSSLPSSGQHLREWSRVLSEVIRESNGEPALMMVWPEAARAHVFGQVLAHYSEAAAEVGGIFIPAGQSWQTVWERDASIPLYGSDGFHPGPLGTLAAALTVYWSLYRYHDTPPTCELPTPNGVSEEVFALLCEAAKETVEQFGAP